MYSLFPLFSKGEKYTTLLFLRAVAGDDSINSASAALPGPPALSGKWPCVHLASVIL